MTGAGVVRGIAALLAAALAALTGTAGPAGQPQPHAVLPVLPGTVVRPFSPPVSTYGPGHRGVDLAAGPGAAVLAPLSGVVTFVGAVAGRGVLVISHPDGLRSSLEPVTPAVKRGAIVQRGQPVGWLSTSAHCWFDSCLHWGVRRGDTYIDPLSLLAARHFRLLPLLDRFGEATA